MRFPKSLSVPVVIRCLILLAGMSVFVSNAAVYRVGCRVAGIPIGAVTTLLEDQKVELDGMWNNNSFGSSGSANFALQLQSDQLSMDFNLNGGVFGQGDPPQCERTRHRRPGRHYFRSRERPLLRRYKLFDWLRCLDHR